MTDYDDLLAQTLDWVNAERSKRGLPTLAEIPSGEMHSARSCPIARALSSEDRVTSTLAQNTKFFALDDGDLELDAVEHPLYVQTFVNAFDNGAYPDLIQR